MNSNDSAILFSLIMEGYDYEFVPAPESRYECPICYLVLREPYQTKCGHIFCRGCITKSLRDSSQRCPMDNEPLEETDIHADNFSKREIINFRIKCPNNKYGCDKIFSLKKLEDHLEECCFAVVSCPYKCACKIKRWEINDHITSSCENRIVTCEHCTSEMQAQVLENHLLVCPKIVVTCTYCGEKKARSELPHHTQKECHQVVVRCPFYRMGCSSSMMRSLVEEHLMLAGSSHMRQLCYTVTVLAQRLGIVHLICKTSSKDTYENQKLICSASSESAITSQNPNQCENCLMDINTDQSPIISETLMAQLHAINLEEKNKWREEVSHTTDQGSGNIPVSSFDCGENSFTHSNYSDSCPMNSSYLAQDCSPFIPENPRADISICGLCNHSDTSTTPSTLINHDSESPTVFYQDLMKEASGHTSSNITKVIQEICSQFKDRETVLQDKFEELHNKFIALEQVNLSLVKVVKNLEQHVVDSGSKFYNGDFCWYINNFSQYCLKLNAGESSMLHSPPFYTNPWGYKMCVRANIDKCLGKGQLSLFVHLMRGRNDEILTWPFSGKISLCLVDQNPDSSKRAHLKETLEANPNLAAFKRPTTPRNHKGFGYIGFVSISELENNTFLMHDTVVIRTQVFSNSQ